MRTILFIFLFTFIHKYASSQVVINELLASNLNTNKDEFNEANDWLELYNTADTSIDLSGWNLTDDINQLNQWSIPPGTIISGKSFLLIWADKDLIQGPLHANFKLSAQGEMIVLSNNGSIEDSITFGPQNTDISLGRSPDGSANLGFFVKPTPGTANTSEVTENITTATPSFSLTPGFYSGSQTLTLNSATGTIYFTTDGSEPNINSAVYSSPISINNNSVVRAFVQEENSLPGPIVTNSYFIDEGFESRELPVISLSTDSNYFYQQDTGIYVQVFKPEWEYPINIEFFEKDGSRGFTSGAGVKIIGERSWVIPQKMLGISFKSKFGASKLNYPIFPNLPLQEYESIALRASGSDWGKTLFRDGLQQAVTHPHMDTDIQEFRPCIVYLNGNYMGIHNIRSRINEDFLSNRYQIDPDELELIENHGEAQSGNNQAYFEWYNFLSNNNFFNPPLYDSIQQVMEIDNFIDYMITWIFSANQSWGEGNIAMYRSTDGGKWRWLIMDFDRGFENASFPNMEFFTDQANPGQNNPLWASLPLRKLLKNPTFEQRFIQRFADQLYVTYHPITLHAAVDKFIDQIDQEIERHGQRWGDSTSIHGDGIKGQAYWLNKISDLQTFVDTRNSFISGNLINYFSLEGGIINLGLNTQGEGQVVLNETRVPKGSWQGNYFNNQTITLTAVPEKGFEFAYWKNVGADSLNPVVSVDLNSDTSITAVFIASSQPYQTIVINEIKYQEADGFATDWIELYNPNPYRVYIDNWKVQEKNSGRAYLISNNTWIEPGEYLIISSNKDALQLDYPGKATGIGNLPFGLSNEGETLLLIDHNNQVEDRVSYENGKDWPRISPGNNVSIQLITPELDNNKGKNWGKNINNTLAAENKLSGYQLSDIPNQFIHAGSTFDTINLNDYLISTFWPKNTINWTALNTGNYQVNIQDSIAIVTYNPAFSGLDSIKFVATNPDMVSVDDIVYFGVGTPLPKNLCNLTLDKQNSPYFAPKGIEVPQNCTLNITEGSNLFIGNWEDIEVKGLLKANGSPSGFIDIAGIDGAWGALKLRENPDTNNLSHVRIQDANYSLNDSTLFNAAVSVYEANVKLYQVFFENNKRSIYSKMAFVHIDSCFFGISNIGEKANLQFTNAITERSTFEYTFGDNDGIDYDAVNKGVIKNNRFLGGQDDGIDIGQIDGVACDSVLIENNFVDGYNDKAISVGEGSKDILIYRNLLLNSNSGVAVKDQSTAHIVHNTLIGNNIGVNCFEKNEGMGGGIVQLKNSIIYQSDSLAIFTDEVSSLTSGINLVFPHVVNRMDIINEYPLFDNEVAYELSISSPAIDAGERILGNDPDGTKPDLGAKPYFQTGTPEIGIAAYPNPAIRSVTITLNIQPTHDVFIALHTIQGVQIQSLNLTPEAFNSLGSATLALTDQNLASGIYVIHVYHNQEVYTTKITLLNEE